MTRISLKSDAIRRRGITIPAGVEFEVSDRELQSLREAYASRPGEIIVHGTAQTERPQPTSRRKQSVGGRTYLRKVSDIPTGNTDRAAADDPAEDRPTEGNPTGDSTETDDD